MSRTTSINSVKKAHSISSLLDMSLAAKLTPPHSSTATNEVENALRVPYKLVKKKSSVEVWDEVTKSSRPPSPGSDTSSHVSNPAEEALGVHWPLRTSPLSRKLSRSTSLSPPPAPSAPPLPPSSVDAAISITWPQNLSNRADDYFRMQTSNDRALEDADYRTHKPVAKMKTLQANLTVPSKAKKSVPTTPVYDAGTALTAKSIKAPMPRHVQRMASPPRITDAFHPVDAVGSRNTDSAAINQIRQEIIQPKAARSVNHSEYIINRNEIRLRRRIGEGFFGVVWEGLWGSMKVAVKIMKHAQSDDPKQDFFMSEVTAVSKLRHPNITVFYGVTEPPEPLIITELLDCSLHELLQNSSSHRTLPEVVMMRLLQDVAAGVNYLHSRRPSVIHRDVSTSNVLCSMPASASMDALVAAATDTSRPLAKLTDFGLSRNVDRYMTSCVGNLYYLAPEVFRGENYTESADVYSYGILVWEVLTRETPFANMNPQSVAFQAAVQGLRPPMPKDITPQLASLMEQCWHAEPLQRPPFTSIVLELSTVSQLDDAVEALAQAMEGSMMAQKTQPAVYAEFTAVASGELLKWSEISARLREFIANRVSAADLIRRNILRVSPADRTYLGLK